MPYIENRIVHDADAHTMELQIGLMDTQAIKFRKLLEIDFKAIKDSLKLTLKI